MNIIAKSFLPHKTRLLALTAFLSLGMVGCEVTDLQPKDALPEGDAFSSPANIALAVTGVYDAAQSGFYDPLNGTALGVRGYPFGAAATELDDIRGEDVVDIAGFFGIVYSNQITPSSPNIVNMWSTLYALINQANITIEGVRTATANGVIPVATANAYEGEARFLRALAYHQLLLHFAKPYADGQGSSLGVPYRETALNSITKIEAAKAQGRNTVAEVYTKILEDLQFAEDNLPATRLGGAKVTRATKGAAIALKQRIRLHQGNYPAAVTEGNKLISASAPFTSSSAFGSFALAETPQAAFPGGVNTTAENVFSIENSSDDNASVNGALPSMFGSDAPVPVGIAARGLISISPILYNAPFWTCNDLRRTELTQSNGTRYFTRKYRDALTRSDFAPIIRYAEVLLNQAEAEARSGNTSRALLLLNAVRNRAVINPAERYTAASFATPNALTGAILNERRIELVGEGFRWDDIHRLSVDPVFKTDGIPRKYANSQAVLANYNCQAATSVAGATAPVGYTNTRFLWPIPSLEVANNPTLASQQNPGY